MRKDENSSMFVTALPDTYSLNEYEMNALTKFQSYHSKICKGYGITICFQYSGIGIIKYVKCNKCGKIKNITDYNSQ